MSDEPAATLLLQLRLRAFATTEALASAAGVDVDATAGELVTFEERRWVQRRAGRVNGWTLTAAGRRRGQELLLDELRSAGTRDVVVDAYLDFLPLNAELLSICTDWQVVVVEGEQVPNDHSDPDRDAAVLRRLDALHPAAVTTTSQLASAFDRFAPYGPRLQEARDHVASGRFDWLTRASGPSYHGTWFELHELLLTTLGLDRVREPVPQYSPTTIGGPGRDAPVSGHTENGDPT